MKFNKKIKLAVALSFLLAVTASFSAMAQQNSANDTTTRVYKTIEILPKYPGGDEGMYNVIKENLQYPKEALKNRVEGKVVVSFIVDTTGYVTNIKIEKSVDEALDNEAKRLISLLENFTPASQNGKNVLFKYTVPINFRHNLPEKKQKSKNQKK